jgi:MFS superfamily sulfate permease-like transporter/CRP-like cAMP-binding protein
MSVPATDGSPYLAAPEGRTPVGGIRQFLREVTSGAVVGLLALPLCVSAGVVAYEPLGPDYIALGAAAGILGAVAGGLTGALARTSSFIPNITSTTHSLIQASFLGWLLARANGDLSLALALLPLCALMAGLWQILIAVSGLGRVVKFTPYPVLAGFLTGLAILILAQQLPRLFGLSTLGDLLAAVGAFRLPAPAMPLLGAALVVFMEVLERRAPHFPTLLTGLVVGTGAYHLLRGALPWLDLGGTVGEISLGNALIGLHLDLEALARSFADWEIVKALVFTSLTLAILGTLDLTFALRAAQDLADVPAAPRRNLAGQGLSNIVSSLVGGLTVTTSIAFSRTIFSGGGRLRTSTISVSAVLLLAAAIAPKAVGALPSVVLAAILVTIAWRLWDRWCLGLARDLFRADDRDAAIRARRNAAIVVAVTAATVLGQPVAGALVGVALSCLVFIIEMSRPIIRRHLDGSQIFSKRIRSQSHLALLRGSARHTSVLELQGILFFGNADDLASRVKALEGSARTVVLDLKRVTDVDTSGATILKQIAARCRARGMTLMTSAVDSKFAGLLAQALGPGTSTFPDLDAALETAEDRALASAHAAGTVAWRALRIEETDLGGGLSEREMAAFKTHLKPCTYPAGVALCRAGEAADRLWILTRGSVSVRLPGTGAGRRIAGLGPGTSVGEMGLLDRRPRSADVIADEEVEAFILTAESFDRLLRDEPQLGQSLLATIARLTAQRLRVTSEELSLASS